MNYFGTIKLPLSAIHRSKPRTCKRSREDSQEASLPIVFILVAVHELRRSMQGLRVLEPLFYSMPNHSTARQLQQGDTCFCQWIVRDKVGSGLEIADNNNKDDNNGDQAILAEDGAAGHEVPIIDDDKDCDEEFDHLDVSGRVSCNH